VGVPSVAQKEPGPAAKALEHVARAIAGKVSVQAVTREPVAPVA
jgi:hypothetical protein